MLHFLAGLHYIIWPPVECVTLSVSLTILLGTSPHTVAAGDLVDGDNKLQVTGIVSGQRIGPLEVNCQRTSSGTTTTIQHSGKGQFVHDALSSYFIPGISMGCTLCCS